MYNAVDIGVYIVDYCIRNDCPVTNLQLQYMLQILQKKYQEEHGKTLYYDDVTHGSHFNYIPNVYYRFCHYGAMPITCNHQIICLPHEVTSFLHENIMEIAKIPAYELMNMTA